MKRSYFYVLMALSIVPNLSLAQANNIDADVDQELDQIYANRQSGAAVTPAPRAKNNVAHSGGQPIYILNQATPTSNANAQNTVTQVQKQPVAVIESTPLVESKAEMMRKSRQDAEIQTEQKIVEKLESSRLEDEKRRAEALFGNKLAPLSQQQSENAPVYQAPQQQAPVYQQAPAPVVAPVVVTAPAPAEPKENIRDVVREELSNSMKMDKEEAAPTETRYFAGLLGIGDYPDVSNVRGNYAVGATFGTKFDYMLVEGTFMLSNYTVQQQMANSVYSSVIDANQYQAGIAAKYQLMSGLVRPVVGGLAAYSYRKFNWSNPGIYGGYYSSTSDSHAVDLGVSAGVDLELNKKFALGFEYRYMFNLASRVANQPVYTGPTYGTGTPIEKLSYYTLGLAAKVNF